jgi:hypothetical protein
MSYNPYPNDPSAQPPGFGQPVVQQPGQPFAVAPTKGPRRKGMIILGVVLFLVGVVGGGALLVTGGSAYLDGVENLARAPIGCTTSLEFDSPGTFTIYVETKGEIGEVRGDCGNTDTSYEYDGRRLPDVELTLLDPDDDEIDLDDDESKDYEVGDYAGTSIFSVEIEDEGRYSLTVESDDEDFAIAIGKDPQGAAGPAAVAGVALLAVGGLLGLLLFILGLRRKKVAGPYNGGSGGGQPAFAGAPGAPVGYQQPAPGFPPAGPPPASPGAGLGQPQWPSPNG